MHRAGTSAITRALKILGVSLGNNLMPPMKHVNPKGFFEDLEVNALNIDILRAIDSDWSRVAPINANQLDHLTQLGFLQRAEELIHEKCRDTPVFGLKDPRISKLLPFWNQVFDTLEYDVAFVLALRNPLSIAKSLEKRDGFQASHSFFLWLGHMLESLRGSVGRPRLVIDYDQLIHFPEVQVNRMATTLGLQVDELALDAYKTEFLDRNLRHTAYSTEDLLTEQRCPVLIKEIFDWLHQAATDQISIEGESFNETSKTWFNEFERIKPSLELIDSQLGHIAELNQKLADRNTTIADLTDKVVALEQWGMGLQGDLHKSKSTEMELMSSKSWRLTRPLRDARRWLTKRK